MAFQPTREMQNKYAQCTAVKCIKKPVWHGVPPITLVQMKFHAEFMPKRAYYPAVRDLPKISSLLVCYTNLG